MPKNLRELTLSFSSNQPAHSVSHVFSPIEYKPTDFAHRLINSSVWRDEFLTSKQTAGHKRRHKNCGWMTRNKIKMQLCKMLYNQRAQKSYERKKNTLISHSQINRIHSEKEVLSIDLTVQPSPPQAVCSLVIVSPSASTQPTVAMAKLFYSVLCQWQSVAVSFVVVTLCTIF